MTVEKDTKRVSRGIRNNNPGNIRYGGTKWQGLREKQTDGSFCQFTDMTFGIRAIWRLLNTYYIHHKCLTIEAIISRWAPPSDGNATSSYIAQVENRTCCDRDTPLMPPNTGDAVWFHIIRAICEVESLYSPSFRSMTAAFILAFGKSS